MRRDRPRCGFTACRRQRGLGPQHTRPVVRCGVANLDVTRGRGYLGHLRGVLTGESKHETERGDGEHAVNYSSGTGRMSRSPTRDRATFDVEYNMS